MKAFAELRHQCCATRDYNLTVESLSQVYVTLLYTTCYHFVHTRVFKTNQLRLEQNLRCFRLFAPYFNRLTIRQLNVSGTRFFFLTACTVVIVFVLAHLLNITVLFLNLFDDFKLSRSVKTIAGSSE